MSEFKVGDKIVRITDSIGDLKVGTKCEVSRLDVNGIHIEIKSNPGIIYHAIKFELAPEEIKTVTHAGKAYQVDQEYLFSNDGTHLVYGRLKAICPASSYPFEAHDGFLCKYIGLIQDCKDQGTITPAPIELIDGAPYMFYLKTTLTGFYRASRKSFCTRLIGGNKICGVTEATNIRLMTVESK
jgi:hypothetical protein